ncbi:MAG: glycosyltransferase family 2 protein [Hydrogenothermaceae bacterium]
MEKTAIVVLNWNNWEDSKVCIDSLLQMSCRSFDIYFVDNNSEDGSVEKIVSFLKEKNIDYVYVDFRTAIQQVDNQKIVVFIIKNEKNIGYTGGNNSAIKLILRSDYKFIWILNNDTIVDREALCNLIKCYRDATYLGIKVGAIGSLLKHFDGKIQTYCGLRLIPFIGNSYFLKKNSNIDYVCGASLFIPVSILQEIGLFDERFFLYWDDADIGLRIRKSGSKLLCCSESVVFHKEGGTTGGINKLTDYYWVRNGLLFTLKHYPYFLPFVFISYLVKYLIVRALKRQPKNIDSLLKGIFDFFNGKFGQKR